MVTLEEDNNINKRFFFNPILTHLICTDKSVKIFCLASGGAASDLGELRCGGCRSGCGGVSEKTPHAKPRCRKSNPHAALVIYTLKGSSPECRCFLLQWNWAALTWQPWGKGIPAWHTAATSSAGWGTVGTAGRSQGPGTARLPNQPLGSVGSLQRSLVTNSSSSCTKFSVAGPLLAPRLAVSQVQSSPGQWCLPGHVPSGGGSAPWSPAENTVAEH